MKKCDHCDKEGKTIVVETKKRKVVLNHCKDHRIRVEEQVLRIKYIDKYDIR